MKTQQWISEQIKISWHKQKHCVLNRVVCWGSRLGLKQNVLADAQRKSWHLHIGSSAARGSFPSNLSPLQHTSAQIKILCFRSLPCVVVNIHHRKTSYGCKEKSYMYDDKVAFSPLLGPVKDASSACKPWLSCKVRSPKLQQQEDKLHIVQM